MIDPGNNIVQRCARALELEGEGKTGEAFELLSGAWEEASDDTGRCIVAHYLARHQDSPGTRLVWDLRALELAFSGQVASAGQLLPSLYLNAGRDDEDLGNQAMAHEYYRKAAALLNHLPDDG